MGLGNQGMATVRWARPWAGVRQLGQVFLLLAFVWLAACSEQPAPGYLPKELRIGVLPDESEAVLTERFAGLGRYLSSQLNQPYQLVVPEDYADLVERFAQGEFDLAYFGGMTFLQAQQRSGAIPLVMRDIDAHFSSYFLVSADAPQQSWTETNGLRLGFGSPLSTSGHLMPRYFLGQKGINPDSHFSQVQFSGAHDKTAQWVVSGEVDIGAANSQIIDSMLEDGRLDSGRIRILWETPPFADYVWAVRADLDSGFRQQLLNSFLSLSPDNPKHKTILSSLGAGGFLPASAKDFESLQGIATSLGLLDAGAHRQ